MKPTKQVKVPKSLTKPIRRSTLARAAERIKAWLLEPRELTWGSVKKATTSPVHMRPIEPESSNPLNKPIRVNRLVARTQKLIAWVLLPRVITWESIVRVVTFPSRIPYFRQVLSILWLVFWPKLIQLVSSQFQSLNDDVIVTVLDMISVGCILALLVPLIKPNRVTTELGLVRTDLSEELE